MARQLPALVSDQRSIARAGQPPSTVGRAIAALAPDVIRVAERLATQRLQQRRELNQAAQQANHTEALHLSEVEIDISMPFVRRVTMRNLTAWQNIPQIVVQPRPEPAPSKRLRNAGLLGASGVLAVCAGLLARRVGPFAGGRQHIIDVPGRPRA
jgi:hypothetical protein